MIRLYNEEILKQELLKKVGNIKQIASITPYEMSEGRAKGIKVFDISTGGGLDSTVLESKCLDLLCMKYKGVNLSFLSKPGLVAPEYFSPIQGGFLRSFQGGMLYTCGLSNIGIACEDQGESHSIHGRISHTPAEKVSVKAEWKSMGSGDYVLGLEQGNHYLEGRAVERKQGTLKTRPLKNYRFSNCLHLKLQKSQLKSEVKILIDFFTFIFRY